MDGLLCCLLNPQRLSVSHPLLPPRFAGAFMTANLLAHAGHLFACGIARSGAYDRSPPCLLNLQPLGAACSSAQRWRVAWPALLPLLLCAAPRFARQHAFPVSRRAMLLRRAHAAAQGACCCAGRSSSSRLVWTGHVRNGCPQCLLLAAGAYNRTLTPFGFQAEERTYWQVRWSCRFSQLAPPSCVSSAAGCWISALNSATLPCLTWPVLGLRASIR